MSWNRHKHTSLAQERKRQPPLAVPGRQRDHYQDRATVRFFFIRFISLYDIICPDE